MEDHYNNNNNNNHNNAILISPPNSNGSNSTSHATAPGNGNGHGHGNGNEHEDDDGSDYHTPIQHHHRQYPEDDDNDDDDNDGQESESSSTIQPVMEGGIENSPNDSELGSMPSPPETADHDRFIREHGGGGVGGVEVGVGVGNGSGSENEGIGSDEGVDDDKNNNAKKGLDDDNNDNKIDNSAKNNPKENNKNNNENNNENENEEDIDVESPPDNARIYNKAKAGKSFDNIEFMRQPLQTKPTRKKDYYLDDPPHKQQQQQHQPDNEKKISHDHDHDAHGEDGQTSGGDNNNHLKGKEETNNDEKVEIGNHNGNHANSNDYSSANINARTGADVNENTNAVINAGGDSDDDIEILEVKQPLHADAHSSSNGNVNGITAQTNEHKNQQQYRQHQQSQLQSQQQYNQGQQQYSQHQHQQQQQQQQPQNPQFPGIIERHPYHVPVPPGHQSTWQHLWPKAIANGPAPMMRTTNETRAYRLTLLSNTEFTITAVTHHTNSFDFVPTLFGLRKPIKEITKTHASNNEKAIMEEGRWRIPLSIYQVFVTYLNNEPNTVVYGIPNAQLQIASLGKAAAERGYPTPQELISRGVPSGLAHALAPYQRGGVDFVMQRHGRALIADEMGLGKTVQGIAAMACFGDEWPVLVLSPSTARYHWEAEFNNWLGKDSDVNNQDQVQEKGGESKGEDLEEFVEDLIGEGSSSSGNDNAIDSSDYFKFEEEKKAGEEGFETEEHTMSKKRKLNSSNNDDNNEQQDSKKMKEGAKSPTMALLEPHEINVLTTSSETIIKAHTRVVVISYGLIPNLIKRNALFPGQFKCIIVDESHMLKNKKSKRTLAVLPLLKGAKRVVMLSGTPALSKAEELFPQLNALGAHKGWWDNEAEFHEKYVKDKYSDPSFAELHTLLTSTVMIRRLKHNILKDMPSKLRENVFVNVRCPELKDEITEGLFALRKGKGVLGRLSLLHQTDLKRSDKNMYNGQSIFHPSPDVREPAPNGEEKVNRKAVLNKVFQLTGKAKIPVLIDMLKRWIADTTNGKLCIFAHHLAVLNGLELGAGLSNAEGSKSKYIRIDGSTNPRLRQDQITSFQKDPSVRIAVLGVTAAGVGVTLTAASTIWFAELFWTPALLVQAEDRCHRIGQQARVRCLYTIAKGTLDEVLWILLKRKFRALGEFVEGKEMMDIVVHNTYNNEFDAVDSRKCNLDGKDDEEDDDDDVEALAKDGSLQNDIEELALEDLAEGAPSDDDCSGDEVPSAMKLKKKNTIAASAENVICLSDDDDDDGEVTVPRKPDPPKMPNIQEVTQLFRDRQIFEFPPTTKFPEIKHYYMFWTGNKYGLHFMPFCGRVVVSTQNDGAGLPGFGNILVAINDWILPLGFNFPHAVHQLKQAISTPPVRLVFAHDDSFKQLGQLWYAMEKEKKRHLKQSKRSQEAHIRPSVATSRPNMAANMAAAQSTTPSSELPKAASAQNKEASEPEEDADVIEILDD